jgi:hypothetical protein
VARKTRAGVLSVVGVLSVPVVIASVAWACGPSGYGVPETPAAPPASTGAPIAPATTSSPAAPTSSGQPPAVQVQSGSLSTNGASGTSGQGSPPSGQGNPPSPGGSSGGGDPTSAPPVRAQFNARVLGATAGVTNQGGQRVFASSTAPGKASSTGRGKATGKAKSSARSAARSVAPAVSQRTATGDLWSGVTSRANPSLASAAAGAKEGGGLSSGVVAAMALLGLGLAGIVGFALVTSRRRRVAGASKRQ